MSDSERNFDDYAKELVNNAPLIPDEAIASDIENGHNQRIMVYCARVAAYCAQEIRVSGKIPFATDDTDFIDAVQECSLHAGGVIDSWARNPKYKFASYANRAFKRIIIDYLWKLAKGGTGSNNTLAPLVEQWVEPGEDSSEEPEYDEYPSDGIAYAEAPQGYRDPMDELDSAQEEDRALRSLMQPCATRTENHRRNVRLRKHLGLEGVLYSDRTP